MEPYTGEVFMFSEHW